MDFNFGDSAIVQHFNKPEVRVTLRRLTEIEQMAHFQELSKFTIPVAVVRSDTGELIFDNDKKVVIHEIQNVPTTSFVKLLTKGISKIEGLRRKGVDLSLEESTVGLFWRKDMNQIEPHPKAGEFLEGQDGLDDKDKKKYPDTIEKPFWSVLVDALMSEITFEVDPMVAT